MGYRYDPAAASRRQTAYAASYAVPDPTRPGVWEIVALLVLVALYAVRGSDSDSVIDTVGPLWLSGVLLLGAVRMVRMDQYAIWSALVWFRISTATYFGIGSVLHHLFTYESWTPIFYMVYFPPKTAMVKFNVIVAWCTLTIIATSALAARSRPYVPSRDVIAGEAALLRFIAFLCVGVGYAIKYLVQFPAEMEWYGDFVVPGALKSLALLAPPGLFLGTVYTLRFWPALVPALVVFVIADCTGGLLRFSKTDVMLPLLMALLGILYVKFTMSRLLMIATTMVLSFAYLQPLVGYGRTQLSRLFGDIHHGSFTQRFEIAEGYVTGRDEMQLSGDQLSYQRIAYVFSAAPAIDLYDRGRPGSSLEDALVVLIPRVLWPGKPVFDSGARYNQIVYGSTVSSSWMGYYAEAYWNLGWLGIPVVMIPFGLAAFVFSRYALWVLATRRWIHFPNVFIGLFFGFRTDGSLATEAFVSCFVAWVAHYIANWATVFLQRMQSKRSAGRQRNASLSRRGRFS